MDKRNRKNKQKSDSSEEEDDFESADEGDQHERTSPLPSLKVATSPGDDKNSTSRNQVTTGNTAQTASRMASTESSLSSTTVEEVVDSNTSEPKSPEHGDDMVIDQAVVNTESVRIPERGDSAGSSAMDGKIQDIGEEKVFKDDSISQDMSSDEEVQFKSGAHVSSGTVDELEKTQTDEEITIQNKATLEQQDSRNVNEIAEQRESPDVTDLIKTDNVEEESEINLKDTDKANNELPEERSAETVSPESKEPEEEKPAAADGWGWGSWGSMLSQATASVSSGLTSVIETVESSLGIPEPSEIAQKVAEDEKDTQKVIESEPTPTVAQDEPTQEKSEDIPTSGEEHASYLSVFGVKGFSGVVSEGLGALEYIGKKTIDAISEGDPGLRNKREVLMPKQPTLSQMLREAKEDSEYKAAHPDHKETVLTVNFSTEFDKFQGLAHLEALEILSKESESKIESHIIDLTAEELNAIKPLLRTIQEVVQFDDADEEEDEEQDFDSEVSECLADLHLSHVPNKTKGAQHRAKEWIDCCINAQKDDPCCRDHMEIFTAGISALAELTACSVEQFQKIAEVILLLAENNDTSALVRAQSLKKFTVCVCREVSNLSGGFAGCLSTVSKESTDSDAIECLITTLYLESSDSARYLQHAFKLLCPVLQNSSLLENFSTVKC